VCLSVCMYVYLSVCRFVLACWFARIHVCRHCNYVMYVIGSRMKITL